MKRVESVLSAIMDQNVFEYMIVDKALNIVESSPGVKRYLGEKPVEGIPFTEYLPEYIGVEQEIKETFKNRFCTFRLENVRKNEFYLSLSVAYGDADSIIILIKNTTETSIARQQLQQYSNESSLLYGTLQKVMDHQDDLIFITSINKIEFASEKFLHYFKLANQHELSISSLNLYSYFDGNLKNYHELFSEVVGREQQMQIGHDHFIVDATPGESFYKVFTLKKVQKEVSNQRDEDGDEIVLG